MSTGSHVWHLLRYVYNYQDKPLLFVLNVKNDLSKSVNLRRFLKNPSAVLNNVELRGHFDRIRQLAGEQLEIRNVRIIPIHAQAAYLSTRPEHEEYADILAEHCGLGDLLNELESHVSRCGTVRRLQTIIDGTQNRLLDLQADVTKQAKDLSHAARRLEEKFGELDVWLEGFVRATQVAVTTEAAKFVQPLRSSVSYFIDENIERDDVGERWTRKVKALDAEGWLKRRQQIVLDELHARLVEFSREMTVESEIIGAFDAARPSHFDPWDVKRTLRWTSTATGAMASIAAIAGCLSVASFWNPVGWIAGGISVIALGLSWCFDDREKKVQGQKAKTAGQLRESIDKFEQELAGVLIEWFNGSVSNRLLGAIRRDTKRLYDGMQDLSRILDGGARQIGAVVEALNRRLLLRVGQFSGAPIEQDRILRVVRDPGIRSKFLWRDGGDLAFCRQVGLAIGERVDGIPDGPVAHRIAWSLRPASVAADKVSVLAGAAVVRLPQHEIGRAKGRGGINVSLASRLMHIRIKVIDEARNANG